MSIAANDGVGGASAAVRMAAWAMILEVRDSRMDAKS